MDRSKKKVSAKTSGGKNKPWDKTGASQVRSVAVDTVEPRQSFLIICEGAQTERNYFESFRATKSVRDFAVRGLGANTQSLVREALRIRDTLEKERGAAFDQAWCVFDRDDFPAQNFNAAIQLAMQNGFQVAYTNQAFELWYLLHFDYHNAALHRHQYLPLLNAKLGERYRKNSRDIYGQLRDLGDEGRAMTFADNLLKSHKETKGHINPESDDPSTTVHCLVRELRNQSAGRIRESRGRQERSVCQEVMDFLRNPHDDADTTDVSQDLKEETEVG